MRGLLRTLVTKGSVEVSVARAKEARGFVDRLFSIARRKTLVSHRKLVSILGGDEKTVKSLTDIALKLSRPDGSLRLIRLGTRRGDSSPRARLEWSKKPEEKTVKVKKEKDVQNLPTKNG